MSCRNVKQQQPALLRISDIHQKSAEERVNMKEMVGGCCVCSDERGWAENPLVYCDGQGCNVAVHQACYGIVQVPTGPWFCRKCESQERAARVRCELCPSKDGALKRTDNGGWAHVVCALYIPEVRFGNVTTMEPIILELVPQERYNKSCYICASQGKESKATIGACMQCNKSGCKNFFHVTCAQAAGLLCEEAGNYFDNVKYCGYCHYHYQKLKKDSHIKTIPAFKPIPAGNATPEPSPEKLAQPRGENRERVRGRAEKKSKIHGISSVSLPTVVLNGSNNALNGLDVLCLTSNENSSSSHNSLAEVNGLCSGKSESTANGAGNNTAITSKFTTANFTETVITESSSPVFGSEKHKKKKSPQQSGQSAGEDKSPSPTHLVSSSGSPPSNSPSSSNQSAANHMATSTSSSALTFSSMYESFISGTLNPEKEEPGENHGSTALPTKRPRSHSADKTEKKKHKKNCSNLRSKIKANKDSSGSGDVSPSSPQSSNANSGTNKNKKKRHDKTSSVISTGLLSSIVKQTNITNFQCSSSPSGSSPQLTSSNLNDLSPVNSIDPVTTVVETKTEDSQQASENISSNTNSFVMSSCAMVLPPKPTFSASTRNSLGISGDNNAPPPFPQTLEQLLERQWDQGSQFLMEQAQHFDIASLLSCLSQLQAENRQLEEHVSNLIARRDHLLAVNARLALPLNTSASYLNGTNAVNGGSISPDTLQAPRLNSFLAVENGILFNQQETQYTGSRSVGSIHSPEVSINGTNMPVSPAPIQSSLQNTGTSPGHQGATLGARQNHLSQSSAFITSPSPVGQSVITSVGSQTSVLDLPHIPVTSSLLTSVGHSVTLSNLAGQDIIGNSSRVQGHPSAAIVYQTISPPYSNINTASSSVGNVSISSSASPLHSLCTGVMLPVTMVTSQPSFQRPSGGPNSVCPSDDKR
ncbi:coiled coil domain containing protein Alhambra [Tachypleus tridentatus]|uniref:coiled coil domain containing protein Alhambra n=1 Tax=Tachypleus tridentatus TaxID=6853 RepID=UPI003FD60797